MRSPFAWPALLLAAALVACQATQPAAPVDAAGLRQQLQAAIGDAACEADAQCRSVAVGAKACGGPSGWLAYSTLGGQAGRIQALAGAQAEAARREGKARGTVSDCALVPDPGARCGAGRCVPGGAGQALPQAR